MVDVVHAVQNTQNLHAGLQCVLNLWLDTGNLFRACALSDGQLIMNPFGIFYIS